MRAAPEMEPPVYVWQYSYSPSKTGQSAPRCSHTGGKLKELTFQTEIWMDVKSDGRIVQSFSSQRRFTAGTLVSRFIARNGLVACEHLACEKIDVGWRVMSEKNISCPVSQSC